MYLNKLRDQAVRVAKGSTSRRITLITKCKCIQEENVAISGRLIDAARAAEPGEAKAFTDNICVGTSNEEWLEAYRRHVLGRRKELIALAVFDILYICDKRCIDVNINEADINERIRTKGTSDLLTIFNISDLRKLPEAIMENIIGDSVKRDAI